MLKRSILIDFNLIGSTATFSDGRIRYGWTPPNFSSTLSTSLKHSCLFIYLLVILLFINVMKFGIKQVKSFYINEMNNKNFKIFNENYR